jgi:hypothetical protein
MGSLKGQPTTDPLPAAASNRKENDDDWFLLELFITYE